jgi:conjugal transfer/type IV secretion protein DotA/TraY
MDIFRSMDACAAARTESQTANQEWGSGGGGASWSPQQLRSGMNQPCLGQSGGFGGAYFMSAMLSALIAAGVTLGYMLPLLPFIRFMFGILSWILALLETVIAIPVVALAHIKMDGEGLSGPMARGAYLLLLQLFLRPTLMVFGLISALLIFNFMIVALNEFYTQAVAGATDSGKLGGIALIIYSVIYASLAYAFANASFKAIDMIPNQVLLWIGGPQGQTVDESHRVTGAVGQAAHVGGSGLSAHSLGQGGSHRYIQGASDDPAMKKQ